MKTTFEKIGGRWVVPTGKVVAIGYINYGDDYDTILADQYKDVCTGETFGKELDEFTTDMVGEKSWRLVKHYDELPEYRHVRKNRKKAARAARINAICGVHWVEPFGLKRIGKNRKMARIMYPNAKQLKEFEDDLPF